MGSETEHDTLAPEHSVLSTIVQWDIHLLGLHEWA
jgi:hypothetical protein